VLKLKTEGRMLLFRFVVAEFSAACMRGAGAGLPAPPAHPGDKKRAFEAAVALLEAALAAVPGALALHQITELGNFHMCTRFERAAWRVAVIIARKAAPAMVRVFVPLESQRCVDRVVAAVDADGAATAADAFPGVRVGDRIVALENLTTVAHIADGERARC